MSKSSRRRYQATRRRYKQREEQKEPREEQLDRRNVYGLPDPTPQEAVRQIIRNERSKTKEKVMTMKRQLVFRKTYYTGIKGLDPEKRLEAYDAIMQYAFETPPELSTLSKDVRPVVSIILDSIEADFQRWKAKQEERGGSR